MGAVKKTGDLVSARVHPCVEIGSYFRVWKLVWELEGDLGTF